MTMIKQKKMVIGQRNLRRRCYERELTEIVPVGMVVPNTGEWSLLVVTVT